MLTSRFNRVTGIIRPLAIAVLISAVAAGYGGVSSGASQFAGGSAGVGQKCVSYRDCPAGTLCMGASPTTTGRCVPASSIKAGKMAHDIPGRGQIGTIYGQPIIRGEPPLGAPPAQSGGTWDMATGTYYPPQGGGWRYQPGPNHGFGGRWVFDPALVNPAPGHDVIDSRPK